MRSLCPLLRSFALCRFLCLLGLMHLRAHLTLKVLGLQAPGHHEVAALVLQALQAVLQISVKVHAFLQVITEIIEPVQQRLNIVRRLRTSHLPLRHLESLVEVVTLQLHLRKESLLCLHILLH